MAEVSLDRYVTCICDMLKAQPEPVVLVGHSLGSAVITQAAEHCPDRVIFLATSHNPYLSAPEVFTNHLLSLAAVPVSPTAHC